MTHLPTLISDLTIILVVAAIVSLIFKRIKQPVVLGYILAGLLVGPEIGIIPTVQDKTTIHIWAEIGVIFLMFTLGLEFSFKKLASSGKGASVTAMSEVLFMFTCGYLLGQAFDWGLMDSLFLGGILSISSTTIIIRAFDELGHRKKAYTQLVFGVLIVEDIVAVLLLVLLSTLALTQSFDGMPLLLSTAKLFFFLSLWFVAGIFLIPVFLKKVRHYLNQDTTLIVAIAFCFFMVFIATQSGFSAALGAFIMGSILAETPDREKMEHQLKPVKDLFAAVFFVSVGMLIELKALIDHWEIVLIVSFVTIIGKTLSSGLGALLSGQSLKHSVQAGLSLAQIGEFSFIIATLGMSLKVTSSFLYPIAVAVSVLTTFTTPYMIRSSENVFQFIDSKLSPVWRQRLQGTADSRMTTQSKNQAKSVLRIILNSTIIVAVSLFSSRYALPIFLERFSHLRYIEEILLAITLALCLPFFWALVFIKQEYTRIQVNRSALKNLTLNATLSFIARLLFIVFLLTFVTIQFSSLWFSAALALIFMFIIGFVGFKKFGSFYHYLEGQFISRLSEQEQEKLKKSKLEETLAPWDATLIPFIIEPESRVVGKTLSELSLREHLGVTVAFIERGTLHFIAPNHHTRLMPYDKIFVLGNEQQVENLEKVLSLKTNPTDTSEDDDCALECIAVSQGHPFVGYTLGESHIREKHHVLVVGIERDNTRILNPMSHQKIQAEDRLWIVGSKFNINQLSQIQIQQG